MFAIKNGTKRDSIGSGEERGALFSILNVHYVYVIRFTILIHQQFKFTSRDVKKYSMSIIHF